MFQRLQNFFLPSSSYPFYMKGRTDVIFIHITKTAGTSVARTLNFNKPKQNNIKKHHTTKEIVALVGENNYHRAYKFCFVRNPWARLLSYFWFKKNKTEHFDNYLYKPYTDFNEWLFSYEFERALNLDYHLARNQVDWITSPNGQIEVNFIGRFENLEEDFRKVCGKIKVGNLELKQLNTASSVLDYRKTYSTEAVKKVEQIYNRDIDYFGYKFGC